MMNMSKDESSSHELMRKALLEVEGVFTPSTFIPIEQLCKKLSSSKTIVSYGVGREGLMMKSLTMRLMHSGLHAYFVGDMNVPPVGPGDLLLVSAGPGNFSTVNALIDVAKNAGASVSIFTAQPDLLTKKGFDQVIHIPARTMADDKKANDFVLPMGSLYEAALFLYFEIIILKLRDHLGETADSMRNRHTNLE